jgi:hypothetical protein
MAKPNRQCELTQAPSLCNNKWEGRLVWLIFLPVRDSDLIDDQKHGNHHMRLKTSHTRIQLRPFATGIRLVAAIALLAVSALAADLACSKSVSDATTKYLTVPTHIYTTEDGAYTGGKSRNVESIYLIDKAYVQVNGRWRESPVSPKMMLNKMKEAHADADKDTHSTCQMVREEAINGEAATLYSSHTETKDMKADSQIWISKSRGLPLKMEQTSGTGAGKNHRVSRFQYTNVQPPSGAR